jgi:hypothetical protein
LVPAPPLGVKKRWPFAVPRACLRTTSRGGRSDGAERNSHDRAEREAPAPLAASAELSAPQPPRIGKTASRQASRVTRLLGGVGSVFIGSGR